jgi:hypothetical protein
LVSKRAKRYAGLVEQCAHLTVPDLLSALTPAQRALPAVRVSSAPGIVLLRTSKGALKTWWWLVCPNCHSRREALHRPNWAARGDWRCVRCHKLTWASRRHGKSERSVSRHLHRRNPGHRTRQRIEQERARMVRKAVRPRRQDEQPNQPQDRGTMSAVIAALLDKARAGRLAVAIESTPGQADVQVVGHAGLVEAVRAKRDAEQTRQQLRDALVADRAKNAAILARYAPRSRILQAKAARLLDGLVTRLL